MEEGKHLSTNNEEFIKSYRDTAAFPKLKDLAVHLGIDLTELHNKAKELNIKPIGGSDHEHRRIA